jgi:hypothetical protein
MPLQAADLYAHWVRKWHQAGRRGQVSFPWQIKRKMNILNLEITEEHLRKSYSTAAQTVAHTSRVVAGFQDKSQVLQWLEKRYEGIKMTLPDPSSKWRE